ncbi:MAG: amino acid permease [Bacteroidota bacterium]
MPELREDIALGLPDGKKVGLSTATAIVIANMIGTGVFTSLGFQANDISSYFALLMLWVVGGIIALCGALTYGELASAMPRSGGEYIYLGKIYHPLAGFLSGWVSVTVGFAAPTALAAMALSKYAGSVLPDLNPTVVAITVVLAVTAMHVISLQVGSYFQLLFTAMKVMLIVIFACSAFFLAQPVHFHLGAGKGGWDAVMSPAFATSLVYVSYAYSGWNAAVYLAGEIRNPRVNLPKALLSGTAVVMGLYLLLNFVFLYTTPLTELKGHLEVGYLSAVKIYGAQGGKIMGLIIALLLVSTVSAMTFAGPRVMMSMGEDIPAFSFLGRRNKRGLPVNAILFQTVLTLVLILTSTFEDVMTYAGFTLALFTMLTVTGLFVLRIKFGKPKGYLTPFYPFPPIIFLALTLWTLVFIMRDKPMQSAMGLLTLAAGVPVYFLTRKKTLETTDRKA